MIFPAFRQPCHEIRDFTTHISPHYTTCAQFFLSDVTTFCHLRTTSPSADHHTTHSPPYYSLTTLPRKRHLTTYAPPHHLATTSPTAQHLTTCAPTHHLTTTLQPARHFTTCAPAYHLRAKLGIVAASSPDARRLVKCDSLAQPLFRN